MRAVTLLEMELRRVDVPADKASEIVLALNCSDRPDQLAECIMGYAMVRACEYHTQKMATRDRQLLRMMIPPDARKATGGPQRDPGDVEGQQPLF